MSIHDFHSKFVSAQTENALFRALRKLSQAEDAQSLLTQTPNGTSLFTWAEWSAPVSGTAR
jgi:hypothetical protein